MTIADDDATYLGCCLPSGCPRQPRIHLVYGVVTEGVREDTNYGGESFCSIEHLAATIPNVMFLDQVRSALARIDR